MEGLLGAKPIEHELRVPRTGSTGSSHRSFSPSFPSFPVLPSSRTVSKDVGKLALVVVEPERRRVVRAADVDDDVALGEDVRVAGADDLRVAELLREMDVDRWEGGSWCGAQTRGALGAGLAVGVKAGERAVAGCVEHELGGDNVRRRVL